jgi:tRNA (guanine37-N1)-methyltransferase
MRLSILTIHPGYFDGVLREGLINKAIQKQFVQIQIVDIRQYAPDKHKRVDDQPYGGGPGMVLKVEPIVQCLRAIRSPQEKTRVVVLAAKGKKFTQKMSARFSRVDHLILICGRYEGIDERVSQFYADEEIRIGDYVLMGGEAAASVVLEATVRHLPGVLGNPDSLIEESFSAGAEREHEQYTRPPSFEGHLVPEVLLRGNHADIQRWRKRRKS